MSKTPAISIIVPVYNCEKYISSCIKSILSQTYRNIELILVDDGSTDSSADICRSFINSSDIHIQLISKPNGGVSSARNTGIAAASGKYIMFIDSDDTVDKHICSELIASSEASSALMSLCGYSFVNFKADGSSSSKNMLPTCNDIHSLSEFKESYPSMFFNRIYLSSCAKLYLRSLISDNNLCFDEEHSLGEDLLFVHKYLEVIFNKYSNYKNNTTLISVCKEAMYNYNQYSSDSLSRSYSFDRIDKNAALFNKAMELVKKIGIDDTATNVLSVYYMRSINIVFLNNNLSNSNTKSAFIKCCNLNETRASLSNLKAGKPEQLLYILTFKNESMLWLRTLCTIRKFYLKLSR